MIPWAVAAAGVAAAGSIGGGIMSSNAAKSAAGAQTAALQQAQQFQQGVYGNTVQNLSPYLQGGNTSLSSLMGLLGLGGTGQNANAQSAFQGFTQTPSYQFPLQQGNLALNRQLAASGLTSSGGALKDAVNYNQGYASQGLNSYMGQLGGLVQGGQNAAALQGSQGNQASGILGQILGNIGQSNAAGIMGSNNAMNQGIGQAGGALGGLLNSTAGQGALTSMFGGSSYPSSGAGSWGGSGGTPTWSTGQGQ